MTVAPRTAPSQTTASRPPAAASRPPAAARASTTTPNYDRFGPSGDWPSDGNRSSGGERLQRAQAFGPNSHRFSPNDDGTIVLPTVMQRNVAVKDPGAGGVRFDPSDHQIPAQAAQSRPNGTSDGRKALSVKSIGPSGGPGDDHPAIKLIVRTQKRLEAEEVPSQLESA